MKSVLLCQLFYKDKLLSICLDSFDVVRLGISLHRINNVLSQVITMLIACLTKSRYPGRICQYRCSRPTTLLHSLPAINKSFKSSEICITTAILILSRDVGAIKFVYLLTYLLLQPCNLYHEASK